MDLIVDLAATAVVFVALVRIVATPAQRWGRGRLSKTAWVIAALWWTPLVHGLAIPAGAALALWHVRRINRSATPPAPPELRYADGAPLDTDNQEAQP